MVSIRSRLDGAGLTRATLEATAEVVAMRKGEGRVFDRSEWTTGGIWRWADDWRREWAEKRLGGWWLRGSYVTICTFVSKQTII